MNVRLGSCGLVIAFLCVLFGMTEVGLWTACYFECPTGQEIEFNFFAAVWTGVLAFAIGFMIVVLFCVKFKSLGTFIIILTFILVPCEIICACIYAYRAYLSRPTVLTGNVGVDYISVFMYSGMSVCAVFLFVITVMWNCYYCCIATPTEDYEEEVKEDLEEEQERQEQIRSAQDRFINNPIIEDDLRDERQPPLSITQPHSIQYQDNRDARFPNGMQNRYPDAMQHRHQPESRYMASNGYGRDRRNHQSAPIRDDYPYPPTVGRNPVADQRNRKSQQQLKAPRPQYNPQSNLRDGDDGGGQVNHAYEPDAYGRPLENTFNGRSYLYDGTGGAPLVQSTQHSRYNRGDRTQHEQSRSSPNGYGTNPSAEDSRYHNANHRHINRDPQLYGHRALGNARQQGTSQQRNPTSSEHIYRPRPENFRGKPTEPKYLHQQRVAQNGAHIGEERAQYSGFRDSGAVNTYF